MSKEENVKNNTLVLAAERKVGRAKKTLNKNKDRLAHAQANGGAITICKRNVELDEYNLDLCEKNLKSVTRLIRRVEGLPKEEAAYTEVSEFSIEHAAIFLAAMFSIMAVCIIAANIIGSA